MNKRILVVLIVLGIMSVGAVSAFDFDSLLGDSSSSEAQNVTVDGIEFSIPAGFDENITFSVEDFPQSSGGVDYVIDSKTFENEKDAISLLVATYDGYDVDDDAVAASGGNKTTINGVDGYLLYEDSYYSFSYPKDGKLAVVSVSDADLIKDIVIA